MIASWHGHESVVKAPLEKGASIDLQRKDGATGLVIARRNGHRSISAGARGQEAAQWKEQKKSRLKKTRTISLGE
jgi:ankyrin repeat protein